SWPATPGSAAPRPRSRPTATRGSAVPRPRSRPTVIPGPALSWPTVTPGSVSPGRHRDRVHGMGPRSRTSARGDPERELRGVALVAGDLHHDRGGTGADRQPVHHRAGRVGGLRVDVARADIDGELLAGGKPGRRDRDPGVDGAR